MLSAKEAREKVNNLINPNNEKENCLTRNKF